MKKTEVDWKSGRVTYWVMDEIDGTRPLKDQPLELCEDLAQVEYARGRIVDIGWYPQHSPNGRFFVLVVLGQDWEHPILRIECKTLEDLTAELPRAISVAEGRPPPLS